MKARGAWVRGVDLNWPEYASSAADEFELLDLRCGGNTRAQQVLAWPPRVALEDRLRPTYAWIEQQVRGEVQRSGRSKIDHRRNVNATQ